MGLKYNKNDGQLLSSALTHNLEIADQIVEDVQEGVNHLLSMIGDPFGGLEGQAYHAAGTLFQEIVKPTLSKLKEATEDIKDELRTFDYERSNFNTFPDPVYDMDDIVEHLEIKKQQKATVDFQMNLFNNQLANSIAKKAMEDFIYEGQRLQSVANHYEDEIKELEAKKRILEEFSSATASLFQESLHTFQNAMNGAKALKTGSFDSQGNFSMSSSSDLSWYKKITGKDISRDLLHEPSHLTASDIEEQIIAGMNAQTKAQLEQIALATGLTLAEVIALYAKASKTMAVKGGEVIHNVWDFISGEFGKLSPENRVKDGDVIKTIVYYTNQGNLKVIYDETQNIVLATSGGSFMDNLANFNGISGNTEDSKGLEYVNADETKVVNSISKGHLDNFSYIETRKNAADNWLSAMSFKDSYHSEEQSIMTGQEYLDKVAKEKEKKRQEEAIKAQQRISGGGNPATLGS
ncbi:hypothetical protein [Lactococcus garvieae]